MRISEFCALLNALSDQSLDWDLKDVSGELLAFRRLLASHADVEMTSAELTRIRASWPDKDFGMDFGRAFKMLIGFRRTAESVGRKADLTAVSSAIKVFGSDAKPPKAAANDSQDPTPVSSARAQAFLLELVATTDDGEKIPKVIAAVRKAKLSLGELNWLAEKFAGATTPYTTGAAAVRRITDRAKTRSRRATKSAEIDKLTS